MTHDLPQGVAHSPRCNFWCRNGSHHLLPDDPGHAWVADGRPFVRDRCRVCGGGFHKPTNPKQGDQMFTTECDETNPECRCPECVNAGSDIADTTR